MYFFAQKCKRESDRWFDGCLVILSEYILFALMLDLLHTYKCQFTFQRHFTPLGNITPPQFCDLFEGAESRSGQDGSEALLDALEPGDEAGNAIYWLFVEAAKLHYITRARIIRQKHPISENCSSFSTVRFVVCGASSGCRVLPPNRSQGNNRT